MDNKSLTKIKEFIIKELKSTSGFCRVIEGDNMIMINSDDGNGNDIIINITIQPE